MRRSRWLVPAAALLASCGSSAGDSPGAPPADPAMLAPFTDASAFGPVNEAFSATASAPWGFAHGGIDLFPLADGTPLRAATGGTVTERTLWRNPASRSWQVNVGVRFNSRYTVEYTFEPFSVDTDVGAAQSALVPVALGDTVAAGQALGSVKVAGSGAHLHFGLIRDGTRVCPEPYFEPGAAATVLALIQRDHPDWQMCY